MKKLILTLFAFLMAFGSLSFISSNDAQAQISVELVGKLGGEGNWIENEWLGDPKMDVSGGLRLSGLVRFANNIGVGLNFNWTMSNQSVTVKGLAVDLNDMNKRNLVVQHPSFGVNFRYMFIDMIDVGLWMNYAFGNATYDPVYPDNSKPEYTAKAIAMKYRINDDYVDLKYQLQSFEIGILAHFRWYIPNTTFAIIVGLEMFLDFSRMNADDSRMAYIDRGNQHHKYDENSMNSFGMQFVFGVGYDFYFESFGKQLNH